MQTFTPYKALTRIHAIFAFAFIAVLSFCACSNSEGVDCANYAETTTDNNDASSSSTGIDYLPLDDTEYPYAGIPRIVIETENNREIKDRETEIPAKLQIWGEKAPESEVMNLTIRGRGNTSWTEMPKKSYKIEFTNKQSMLGMPKDRDWALIANYADKTLMKNYLIYHLSAELGAYYAPRCEFAELYLNKEYLGVYLLTETIKIAKHRVNIPENDSSYIVEIDMRLEDNEQAVFSHILRDDSLIYNWRFHFEVHYPKKASSQTLTTLENHIQEFERYLKQIQPQKNNLVTEWINIDEFIKHYWVQEFSKNPDADYKTSVYFSWIKDAVIKMGPVWDFDLAFGGYHLTNVNNPEKWLTKDIYWNHFLFNDSIINQSTNNFWITNKKYFSHTIDVVDSIQSKLQYAASNNFKKWNILSNTNYRFHRHSFQSYKEATEQLKTWIKQRINWIDKEI